MRLAVLTAMTLATFDQTGSWTAAGGDKPPRKPNILFILIDDMGWTDAACLGSTFYETPNIDRLAKGGMLFTNGYAAAPVCSPTRASILTGKYPARLGTTDWFGGGARKGKLLPAPYVNHLPTDEVTLAQILRAFGYRTGMIGKWHLGGKGFEPGRYGFDVAIAGDQRGSPPSYFSPFKNPNLKDGPPGEELTDRLTSEAIDFMKAGASKPFFLYLPHYTVHIPLQAKKELIAKYEDKAGKLDKAGFKAIEGTKVRLDHSHATYAAMVETLDINIGRLLDFLEKSGLAEDTIIIFTSDNGGVSTSEGWPTSNRPLRVGKGWLYEGGIRVPWIVRWPRHTPPGKTSDHPVISTDFYPTLLELVGHAPTPKQHVDGVSIAALLKGKGLPPERSLFWHYPHYSNQFGTPSSSMRKGDYTLIEFLEDGKIELYDVVRDIGQEKNLTKSRPELAAAMQRELQEWRRAVGARMPLPNPDKK